VHADIFKEELIRRDLISFLRQVGLVDSEEYVDIMRILIGRIDEDIRKHAGSRTTIELK
jgi:dUTPase